MKMQARPESVFHVPRPCRAWLMALTLPLLTGAGGLMASTDAIKLLDRLPPSWRDDRGETLRLADLDGHRIIVTMAFTSCHRICPVTMTRLSELQHDLDARGTSADFLIVSYDPRNDDPAAWHRYRVSHQLLRENWHFLTGTPADTRRLERLLGFETWNYDEHVIHDYRIVLLSDDGTLRGAVDSAHRDWRNLL